MKKSLGKVLKARRQALGISQRELGRRVNIRGSHVGYLEAGKRRPSLPLVRRLAKVLGLESEPLFLLAHPEVKGLLGEHSRPMREPGQVRGWLSFSKDKVLLAQHKVTRGELKVLSRVNGLGKISSPRHFLFVLNAIRQAIDDE